MQSLDYRIDQQLLIINSKKNYYIHIKSYTLKYKSL